MDVSGIYDVLRRYGPVFSIKVEEEQKTVSVVFWKIEDAHEAVRSLSASKRVDGVEPILWPVHSANDGFFPLHSDEGLVSQKNFYSTYYSDYISPSGLSDRSRN
jgi:hypothetical protein